MLHVLIAHVQARIQGPARERVEKALESASRWPAGDDGGWRANVLDGDHGMVGVSFSGMYLDRAKIANGATPFDFPFAVREDAREQIEIHKA